MKKKTAMSGVYFCLAIVWFMLALNGFRDNSTMKYTYLALGAMWTCIGATYLGHEEKSDATIKYYNRNAAAYTAETENLDMSGCREKFLAYVPEGGLILDWGCGCGRDSVAFLNEGYQVEAVDGSVEMCSIAGAKLGREVKCNLFDDLDEKNKYDGIWASASLLHVEEEFLPDTLRKAKAALKVNGVMYISFKYGEYEYKRDDRYYVDMTEAKLGKLLNGIGKLEILQQWVTEDSGRDNKWINVILRRTA